MSIRYRGADLRNIHLRSGYAVRRLPDGSEAIRIEDAEGLHRAIAGALIGRPAPSSGPGFRFLRKHLGLTQAEAGKRLGAEERAVSLWERGRARIPRRADLALRALVGEPAQAVSWKRLVFAFSEDRAWRLVRLPGRPRRYSNVPR